MFAILALYLLGHTIFRAHKSTSLFIFFVLTILFFSFLLEDSVLSILNIYRIAFIAEDFVAFDGSISYEAWNLYGADNADAFN